MPEHKIGHCGKGEARIYQVNIGRSNGPARFGEGGGAALVCQEIGGSVENFLVTIVYL
jgi:hypothetical protein